MILFYCWIEFVELAPGSHLVQTSFYPMSGQGVEKNKWRLEFSAFFYLGKNIMYFSRNTTSSNIW
jgi:hypothetical protein